MSSLSELDFFAYNTKSLRAEFAIFNGNYKVVSLVALHFNLMSSGRMKPSIDMDTMATFDLHGSAHEIVKTLAQRVLPGVLCVCFSIYFTTSLFRELNQAWSRQGVWWPSISSSEQEGQAGSRFWVRDGLLPSSASRGRVQTPGQSDTDRG
ncbi:unnamed protein product [Prorocentrum cordatum]|uniref:Transmembrane protein 231 n=1 Tax=Prorocentrum cordatum TaxID=2364126 RepID=A0ABN9W4F2_9DINO|nr:unnamed protein product [Polarella glacialis]